MNNTMTRRTLLLFGFSAACAGCTALMAVGGSDAAQTNGKVQNKMTNTQPLPQQVPAGREIATIAGGCFWCVEAIFQDIKGVDKVVSGYSGGKVANPSYEEVCTGATGHAEALQITFDPKVIPYGDLLRIFFTTHNPTTLNRQGHDSGTQYRSAIFYHNDEQKATAEKVIKEIAAEKLYKDPIVTEVTPFSHFYAAEDYHQNYFKQNGNAPYCQAVIAPKVLAFREKFGKYLK